MILTIAALMALVVAGLIWLHRRWVEHELARYDEIGRRERLRILLRREGPRK